MCMYIFRKYNWFYCDIIGVHCIAGSAVNERVSTIADQICGLSLIETGQLTQLLKDKLGERVFLLSTL